MSGGNSTRRQVRRLGSIVALAAVAGSAGAQASTKPVPKDTVTAKHVAKPTSTLHVKIQKESTVSGGEVGPTIVTVTPPCDVVDTAAIRAAQQAIDAQASADQAAQLRARMQDEANQRVAEVRAQLIGEQNAKDAAAALALARRLARGWYVGAGGGFSTPMRSTRTGYAGGYNATVPMGYDWQTLPLGLRLDLSADHLNGTRFYNAQTPTIVSSGDITLWSVSGDVKIRVPAPGGNTRTHLYAVTGVGAGRVSGGVYGTTGPQAAQSLSFANAHTNFAWNAGGGVAVQWGPAELFAESRFMQMKTDMPYWSSGGVSRYTSYTPIVVGLTWF